MGEETSDISRALAAFGAPSIRYHSFGQGQARPPGLTLPRRVAQRPALAPVPAAPPRAPASLAPDLAPPIAEPALRLDEPVEQVRQEQPEAAPETLPVPQPEPQVTPAPVMAAPVMAAPPPPEVPAPEPSRIKRSRSLDRAARRLGGLDLQARSTRRAGSARSGGAADAHDDRAQTPSGAAQRGRGARPRHRFWGAGPPAAGAICVSRRHARGRPAAPERLAPHRPGLLGGCAGCGTTRALLLGRNRDPRKPLHACLPNEHT